MLRDVIHCAPWGLSLTDGVLGLYVGALGFGESDEAARAVWRWRFRLTLGGLAKLGETDQATPLGWETASIKSQWWLALSLLAL